jgi:hypothetical protein
MACIGAQSKLIGAFDVGLQPWVHSPRLAHVMAGWHRPPAGALGFDVCLANRIRWFPP